MGGRDWKMNEGLYQQCLRNIPVEGNWISKKEKSKGGRFSSFD